MKCYIDIDGVLNYYPYTWLEFILDKRGVLYGTLLEAKQKLSYQDYTTLKDEYRTSDYKATLPVRLSGVAITKWLHKEGWTIVIGTTRPVLQYPKLIDTTAVWLEMNEIPHDHLVFHRNNTMEMFTEHPDIVMGIDDSYKTASMIANTGRIMFYYDQDGQFQDPSSNYLIKLNSLYDIVGWLE